MCLFCAACILLSGVALGLTFEFYKEFCVYVCVAIAAAKSLKNDVFVAEKKHKSDLR